MQNLADEDGHNLIQLLQKPAGVTSLSQSESCSSVVHGIEEVAGLSLEKI